jgi:hypothetical protein
MGRQGESAEREASNLEGPPSTHAVQQGAFAQSNSTRRLGVLPQPHVSDGARTRSLRDMVARSPSLLNGPPTRMVL